MNHYDVLQVSRNASPEVIRAAYRSLSGRFHPDKDASKQADEQFKRIQDAYHVLSDADRRREYDSTLDGHRPHRPATAAVVMRVDGSSSFLTLSEHLKRNGQELYGCDLSGLDLSGVSLRGASLKGAKLDGSMCQNGDFRDADFTDCSAKNGNFDGAQFSGATLVKTDFTGSTLQDSAFFECGGIMGTTTKLVNVQFSMYDGEQSAVDAAAKTKSTTLRETSFASCDLRGAKFLAPRRMEQTSARKQPGFGGERTVPLYIRQTSVGCRLDWSGPERTWHVDDWESLNPIENASRWALV